jgi:hypothetical protein
MAYGDGDINTQHWNVKVLAVNNYTVNNFSANNVDAGVIGADTISTTILNANTLIVANVTSNVTVSSNIWFGNSTGGSLGKPYILRADGYQKGGQILLKSGKGVSPSVSTGETNTIASIFWGDVVGVDQFDFLTIKAWIKPITNNNGLYMRLMQANVAQTTFASANYFYTWHQTAAAVVTNVSGSTSGNTMWSLGSTGLVNTHHAYLVVEVPNPFDNTKTQKVCNWKMTYHPTGATISSARQEGVGTFVGAVNSYGLGIGLWNGSTPASLLDNYSFAIYGDKF